jgi:D-alanine-D-alanine ligase
VRRVAIVYNEPARGADSAEADVLEQVRAVTRALSGTSELYPIGATLDLSVLDAALARSVPAVVFNLVEALGGSDRLSALVPLLLDARGIPYTGVGSAAQLASADKVAMKTRFKAAGLPTPGWYADSADFPGPGCYIVKARHDHASLGMDDAAVVHALEPRTLDHEIARRQERFGAAFFAERFVAGREFNLALLADADGAVEVLPPAEIDFSAFEPGKPRIVGWDAKWSEGSFEYDGTPRRFDFPTRDDDLLQRLERLAVDTWLLFGLRGYARVDFRVDDGGNPWILEHNFNPCLSPDAGFAAALDAAGIPFDAAVQRILAAAATD